MIQLYFGSVPSILSTLLFLGFGVFFGVTLSKNAQIKHWGRVTLVVLLVGIVMSALSGTKDAVGTPTALFAMDSFVFIAASVLGGLAVLLGIITLFVRRQRFWQVAFYATSGIIILKTLLVEIARIAAFVAK